MRRSLALAFCLLVALVSAGCDGDEPELRVFAAASLTEVLPRIDPAPLFNFAGSDELATQIREGARADVFAAASPRYPAELFEEGLVEEPTVFATNRLVLIVPSDNPAGIRSVSDLRASGTKLLVAAEGVPAGDYTRRALESMGASDLLGRAVSQEDDVKGVVGKVALGEADAGFVYATDVEPVAGEVEVIELPAQAQPEIEYTIAVTRESRRRGEAEAFVRRVLGEEGRKVLAEAGFGLP